MIIRIVNKLRRLYKSVYNLENGLLKSGNLINCSIDEYNNLLAEAIYTGYPILISRFGSEELNWYLNYKYLNSNKILKYYGFITCKIDTLLKSDTVINNLTFRPKSIKSTQIFINEMDNTIPKIDVLGSWLFKENSQQVKFKKNMKYIYLGHLEPYYCENPWTLALRGKKVLVIHPMQKSIESQYQMRNQIFEKFNILPDMDLKIIKSPYFDDTRFNTWEEIFNYLKSEINKVDFDVAILGCGSWGMPLGGHIKELGKVAIHLGGATQLLFGIIGSRWETQWPEFRKLNIVNNYWVKPLPEETPSWARKFDKNAYW